MGDEWRLVECVYSMRENLLLARRGDPSCIQLMWGLGRTEFQRWYVNLQEPFRPMSAGFDYMDWLLDMVVSPGLSEWRWGRTRTSSRRRWEAEPVPGQLSKSAVRSGTLSG